MIPDRLAEIRALLSDATACEFADLTLTCGELLAELDRLRAAAAVADSPRSSAARR